MPDRERGHGPVRPIIGALFVAAVLMCAASAGALSSAAAGSGGGCHAPLLEGLTFKLARTIAGRAGCKLRVKGNPLAMARIQTVARQSPAAGGVSSTVTVWLNRVCQKGGEAAPEIKEPKITVGPTKLVTRLLSRRRPGAALFLGPANVPAVPNRRRAPARWK